MLRGLSAFAGGFTLDAAEAVCQPLDAPRIGAVAPIVLALVRKSLVERRAGEAPRFHLLGTVRQYLWTLVDERGEAAALLRRHALHFLGAVQRADAALIGASFSSAMASLEAEVDNIRAADEWFHRAGEADSALHLHGALFHLWSRRGPAEGVERVDGALSLPGGDTAARGRAQLTLANCAFYAGMIMTNIVTAFRGAGVDAIAMATVAPQTASAAAANQALGLDVPLIANSPAFVPALLDTPAAEALAKRLAIFTGGVPFSSELPKAREAAARYTDAYPADTPNYGVPFGYALGRIWGQILERHARTRT